MHQSACQRIAQMEELFDTLLDARASDPEGFLQSESLQQMLQQLTEYYESALWLQDYHLDELGYLPPELKRGILSEDGFYNFLTEIKGDTSC